MSAMPNKGLSKAFSNIFGAIIAAPKPKPAH